MKKRNDNVNPRRVGENVDILKMPCLLRDVTSGRLQLPRFQRPEVWPDSTIRKFLMAVCKKRPLGILLSIEHSSVKRNTQLTPRHFPGIERAENKAKELLLDGQQRLTALWKVFNNGYREKVFCIQFTQKDGEDYCMEKIKIERLPKKGDGEDIEELIRKLQKRFCFKKSKKLVPLCFFNPEHFDPESEHGDSNWDAHVEDWLSATELRKLPAKEKEPLRNVLNEIRSCFCEAEMPRFLLPYDLEAPEVISIFTDINTGAKRLSHYDIAVADIEKETHEYIEKALVEDLKNKVPDIEKIDKDDAGELAMKIACVLDDRSPSGANYLKIKPYDKKVFNRKEVICDGIAWATGWLNDLKIYRKQQLPSGVPLRVLPALYPEYQKYVGRGRSKAIRKKKANKLIRSYLWYAFLTDRYMGAQINTKLLNDYRGLKSFLEKSLEGRISKIPVFKAKPINRMQKKIRDVSWPKKESLSARGVLMACLQNGGEDPMSGERLSENRIDDVNYHHIFAKDKLKNVPKTKPDLALNCLFISAPSNVDFKNDLPGTYLEKIWVDNSGVSKNEVQRHLETHLINEELFDYLMGIKNETHGGVKNKDKLSQAYQKFIEMRAKLVDEKINELLEIE